MGPLYRTAVSKEKEVFMPGSLTFSGVRPLTGPSLISLAVSVDVKHHVYLLTFDWCQAYRESCCRGSIVQKCGQPRNDFWLDCAAFCGNEDYPVWLLRPLAFCENEDYLVWLLRPLAFCENEDCPVRLLRPLAFCENEDCPYGLCGCKATPNVSEDIQQYEVWVKQCRSETENDRLRSRGGSPWMTKLSFVLLRSQSRQSLGQNLAKHVSPTATNCAFPVSVFPIPSSWFVSRSALETKANTVTFVTHGARGVCVWFDPPPPLSRTVHGVCACDLPPPPPPNHPPFLMNSALGCACDLTPPPPPHTHTHTHTLPFMLLNNTHTQRFCCNVAPVDVLALQVCLLSNTTIDTTPFTYTCAAFRAYGHRFGEFQVCSLYSYNELVCLRPCTCVTSQGPISCKGSSLSLMGWSLWCVPWQGVWCCWLCHITVLSVALSVYQRGLFRRPVYHVCC